MCGGFPRSEHVAVLDRRAPLDQCAEAVLGPSRLLLGFMQRRDVHHHAFEQQRLAARVPPLQYGVVHYPDHPAVLRQVPVLHLERHAFIDASLGSFAHARGVVRVHASSPTAVGPLGLRVAEHLGDLRRDERGERAVLGRPHLPQIDDRRNVGKDVSELLLGVRALLFRALSLGDLDAHQLVRLLQRGRARAYAELELVVCGGERQLRLLLDGDVDHHPLPAGGVAVDVSQEYGVVAQPDDLSLGADHPVLALPRVAGARREVVRRQLALAIVGMQDLDPHVRLIEPFFHRVAEQVLDHAVHVARAAFVVGVGLVDDGRDVLQQRLVLDRREDVGLFGLDACADVFERAHPATLVCLGVAVGDRPVAHPDLSPVGVQEAVLQLVGFPRDRASGQFGPHHRKVVGVDRLEPALAGLQVQGGRIPEHLLHVRADVEGLGNRRVPGVDVHHDRQVLHDRLEGKRVRRRLGGFLVHAARRVRHGAPAWKSPTA